MEACGTRWHVQDGIAALSDYGDQPPALGCPLIGPRPRPFGGIYGAVATSSRARNLYGRKSLLNKAKFPPSVWFLGSGSQQAGSSTSKVGLVVRDRRAYGGSLSAGLRRASASNQDCCYRLVLKGPGQRLGPSASNLPYLVCSARPSGLTGIGDLLQFATEVLGSVDGHASRRDVATGRRKIRIAPIVYG